MGILIRPIQFQREVQVEQEEQITNLFDYKNIRIICEYILYDKVMELLPELGQGSSINFYLTGIEDGIFDCYRIDFDNKFKGIILLQGKEIKHECWKDMKGISKIQESYLDKWINHFELTLPQMNQAS